MLKSGSSIDIMKFFCFIDDGFDVWAFEQGYFSNNYLPFFLFFGEVVVSDMSDSFKAAWKVDIFGIMLILNVSEPVELLLIIKIFIVDYNFNFFNFVLIDLISNPCQFSLTYIFPK